MLDTDTASYAIKGRSPAIVEKHAALPPSQVCVSAITRAELRYGLKRIDPAHRLHVGVAAFLRIVRVLAWGADAADEYAEIRHKLVSLGQPIGELDMMIAAHAIAEDAVLVTNNTRHFRRVSDRLALANWSG